MRTFHKTILVVLGVALLATLAFFALNTYIYNEKQSTDLPREQKEAFVSDHIEQNISRLSPESEVLGGTFYVTDITFTNEQSGTVKYEDGHIALVADFHYTVPETGDIQVTLSNVREDGS